MAINKAMRAALSILSYPEIDVKRHTWWNGKYRNCSPAG